jgi:hypothetical protein
MRLQVGVTQDASHRAVAHGDVLSAHVCAEQRSRPMRYRDTYVLGRSARLGFDADGIGVREREIGRPERGASASFAAGVSVLAKRPFHRKMVRTCTPSSIAMSPEPTPSDSKRRASARFNTRASVVEGRIAASTCARCSLASGNGFALGPGCARVTHGSALIMSRPLQQRPRSGQTSAERY